MKAFIFTVAGLLLFGMSLFILHENSSTPISQQNKIMDGFVINAHFTEYDETGKVKASIKAIKATHFQPSGTSYFSKPIIKTYSDDRTPWHIESDNGTANSSLSKIILTGHVIVHELPTKNQPGCTITSSKLILFPNEQRGTTDQPVVLSRPGLVIHGTGLIANFKTGKYQLLSQSKIIYNPTTEQSK